VDDLLQLLIDLDDAGVVMLSRVGERIVLHYRAKQCIPALPILPTRLRMALTARRPFLLPFLRKPMVPVGALSFVEFV
jgi:hypothetical protein